MSGDSQAAFARYQAGDLNGAASLSRSALRRDPNDSAAWHVLGLVVYRQGRFDEAIEHLARAIRLNPDAPDVHLHATEVLRQAGRLDQALSAARQALLHKPNSARVMNNLGLVLKDRRQLRDAAKCFQQAIEIDPSYARAYHNLGVVRQKGGDGEGAISALREAVRRQPDYARAWRTLGSLLAQSGKTEQALQSLRQAVALRPDWAEVHVQLGTLHDHLKQYDEAVACYKRAVALRPEWADAYHRLGIALRYNEQVEAAIAALQRALELNPELADARATLACICAEVCDWRDRDATFARLRADVHQRLATGKPSPIAASATCSFPFTLEEHLAVARSSARQFEEQAARSGGRLPPTKQSFVAKRIRLGYLSSDFRDHPVGQLMGSVFQHHDRARFSVCAYSYGQDDKTPYRQLIRSCVERFVDVRKTTDFEIAKRIQADGIDILIDLNGYTVGGRSAVLAHRPAPVQISYLGFPGTMGAQFVDYVIADSTAVPPAEAKFYDEHLIYVPPSYLVASDHAISTTRPTRSAQGLPESGAIFCGFNNSVKIEPEVFDAWMQILRRVPHSVLWLRTNWRSGVANLRREARSRGVDPDRLVFAYKEPYKADHLARQRLADVFLDTPLYNAHTTALDALMAGVPVITCRGRTFAGRGAASLLTGLDMPELIADDLEAYKELAVCLANDPSELSKINKKLALQSAKSDVFSPAGFVNKLERAYEAVRHRYLAGEPAGPISTDDDTPAASVATDQEPIRR